MRFQNASSIQIQDLLRAHEHETSPSRSDSNKEINKNRKSIFNFFTTQSNKKKFEEDYPAFLLAMASALRTGLDPLAAINSVESMLPESSVLRREIGLFKTQIQSSSSEEEAIFSFASSVNHPDVRLFTTALLLSRKEGSSLGACLQRLNRFTRQRQAFRRKAKAAVAMQRLSSFGIVGCSLLIGVMQLGMNHQSFIEAWNHPLGRLLLSGGGSLLCIGFIWMLYLGRSKI
jgi:Flp pilus assembly protein TadB